MEEKEDDLGIGLKIVCFLIPIVGIVLYFVKKEQEPKSAKQACTFALISVGIQVLLYIIVFAVVGIGVASSGSM